MTTIHRWNILEIIKRFVSIICSHLSLEDLSNTTLNYLLIQKNWKIGWPAMGLKQAQSALTLKAKCLAYFYKIKSEIIRRANK